MNKLLPQLCDENAAIVMDELRQELGTIFGYDIQSRNVGITGFRAKLDLIYVSMKTIKLQVK